MSEIGEDIFILLYNQIVPIISVPVQAQLAPPDNGGTRVQQQQPVAGDWCRTQEPVPGTLTGVTPP